MAIAGKVAITPKGEWNAQTAYTKLDLVFYDNASYVAIQPSTGVEPTNTSYWMLVVQSAGGADLDGIINGDIQVGNAKTLDGHGVEYFLESKAEVLSTSILEKVKNLPRYSVKFYKINGSLYTGGDLPSGDYYKYSNALAIKYDEDTATVVIFGFGISARRIAVNHLSGNEWKGWQLYATDADLAKYLPLTGGTLTDVLRFAKVSNGNGYLQKNHTADTDNGFYVVDTSKEGKLARIEVSAKNQKAYFTGDDRILKELLHTGNKPTGAYTGNATERTVDIGGIGDAMLVRGNYHSMIVTASCAFGCNVNNGAFVCEVNTKYENGLLSLPADSVLNATNYKSIWQVL